MIGVVAYQGMKVSVLDECKPMPLYYKVFNVPWEKHLLSHTTTIHLADEWGLIIMFTGGYVCRNFGFMEHHNSLAHISFLVQSLLLSNSDST